MSKKGSKTSHSEDEAQSDLEFEAALKRLEESVRLLEQGNLPLEQSLRQYAESVQLISACQSQLEKAERKIEMLSGFDSAGNPVVTEFDHQGELSLDEKQSARSQRRSVKSSRRLNSNQGDQSETEEEQQLF